MNAFAFVDIVPPPEDGDRDPDLDARIVEIFGGLLTAPYKAPTRIAVPDDAPVAALWRLWPSLTRTEQIAVGLFAAMELVTPSAVLGATEGFSRGGKAPRAAYATDLVNRVKRKALPVDWLKIETVRGRGWWIGTDARLTIQDCLEFMTVHGFPMWKTEPSAEGTAARRVQRKEKSPSALAGKTPSAPVRREPQYEAAEKPSVPVRREPQYEAAEKPSEADHGQHQQPAGCASAPDIHDAGTFDDRPDAAAAGGRRLDAAAGGGDAGAGARAERLDGRHGGAAVAGRAFGADRGGDYAPRAKEDRRPVRLIDAGPGDCRWPLWDVGESVDIRQKFVCGEAADGCGPYCAAHAKASAGGAAARHAVDKIGNVIGNAIGRLDTSARTGGWM